MGNKLEVTELFQNTNAQLDIQIKKEAAHQAILGRTTTLSQKSKIKEVAVVAGLLALELPSKVPCVKPANTTVTTGTVFLLNNWLIALAITLNFLLMITLVAMVDFNLMLFDTYGLFHMESTLGTTTVTLEKKDPAITVQVNPLVQSNLAAD